nr:gas vesicle protein GvpJ [uncultured Actinoplanes sp.]
MTTPSRSSMHTGSLSRYASQPRPDTLGDLLERVLDRGVVIAGDIVVNVLDIELLTLKVRLLIASVDTAKSMGIDWWTHDPFLNSTARRRELEAENDQLRARLEALERRLPADVAVEAAGERPAPVAGTDPRSPR